MIKFWWKGEPLIVGSNRWQIINNDLINDIKQCLEQFKPTSTITEMVKIAHEKGLTLKFKIKPL